MWIRNARKTSDVEFHDRSIVRKKGGEVSANDFRLIAKLIDDG